MKNLLLSIAALLLLAAAPVRLSSGGEAEQGGVDFSRDVLPILRRACIDCHGPEVQESGFRLDTRAALTAGDLSAPNIIPGDAASSPLIHYVSPGGDLEMPPDGNRLSEADIAVLRAWIDQGASWPEGQDDAPAAGSESGVLAQARTHWSFQRLRDDTPQADGSGWESTGVDSFVLARLKAAGLTPSPRSERAALIRRLYLDLHGLPPTPDEVAAFVADERADAYAQLVERVLASPRYGERWGQHWLDVVRFAESHGFETNNERPNAWPYRDYVIAAFNDDKPYHEFIAEQLAGDALGESAATGFLVAGPTDQVKSPELALTLMQRQDELADMANTTATAFLGLTIGCARCHNHKFDPILQRDYYALQAILSGVQHGEQPLTSKKDAPSDDGLLEAVSARLNEETFPAVVARAVRFTARATNSGLEPCLDELEAWSVAADDGGSRNVAAAENGGRPTSSGNYPGSEIHRLEHVNDGQYGNEHSWISNANGAGWVAIEFSLPTPIERITWGRDRNRVYTDRLAIDYSIEVQGLDGKWVEVAGSSRRRPYVANPPMVYAGTFEAAVQPTHRLFRGDPMAPKEIVPPDAPVAFGTIGLQNETPEQQRRLALARWIGSANNPLTARVMVNRIWQHHFGVGLVDTPSDFGGNGSRPTHPELLDWLAQEFIDSGWSVKHVQRLILLSSTYQQSSQASAAGLATDAESRLLWRFPPRRLEAEAIRDAVLYVSGNLDLTMGGPGWRAFEPNDNYVRVYEPKEQFGAAEWRRMVYMQRIRMRPEGVFGAFDAPDGGQVCPKRGRSITAIQALNLFNSRFMLDQAGRFAERLRRDAGEEPEELVQRAFQLAFNRAAEAEEVRRAAELIAAHGLPAFTRAVLNANEFVFIP